MICSRGSRRDDRCPNAVAEGPFRSVRRYLIGFAATIVVLVLALAIILFFHHQRTVAGINKAQMVLSPF